MDTSPLVSICMPVFNGEKYIKEALDSVLSQTYGNLEVIIADNRSTDNTANIIESIADARIKYHLNDIHVDMVENWNISVGYATGKYVKMVHADDVIAQNAVEKQVEAFEKNSEVVICFSASEIINENSETVLRRRVYKSDKVIDGKKYAKKSLRGRNIYGEPTNIMYKKEAFEKIGYYDTDSPYCVDWDFNIRISYLGKACYLSDYLAKYRISSSSETSNLYRKSYDGLLKDSFALMEKHKRLNIIDLNDFDVFYFKARTYIRMLLRIVFIKIQNMRTH